MKYLTAIELSEKWGISSRMIAIHCKKGRISGAIKKGKLWLIPAEAQKPIDNRKNTSNVMNIDENIAEKGISSVLNKAEVDNSDKTHYGSVLYKYLGLTRETLRYYEKIGLIDPKRQIDNSYRAFDRHDINSILEIDFFKKRGFGSLEITNLRKHSNSSDTLIALKKKLVELDQSIYNQQCMRKRLQETQEFYEYASVNNGEFEIRDFPLYSVLKSMDNFDPFSNYSSNALNKLGGEDLLSNIVRAVSFDSTGFKGSKMCIVKKVTGECQDSQGEFLESGLCIYTTVIVLIEEDYSSLIEKIFIGVHKWAKEHGVELKGIVYGFDKFMLWEKNIEEDVNQCVSEIWIPIIDHN